MFEAAAKSGEMAAARIDEVAREIEAVLDPTDAASAVARTVAELRASASALRLAFSGSEDSVAAFEGVDAPWDRWRLAVRLVSPADAFREHFVARLESFAGVSASLFIGGDAFAALGELGIEGPNEERIEHVSVPSPFPYEKHMRVAALSGGAALPGPDTGGDYDDLAFALPANASATYCKRKMPAAAERLGEVAQVWEAE